MHIWRSLSGLDDSSLSSIDVQILEKMSIDHIFGYWQRPFLVKICLGFTNSNCWYAKAKRYKVDKVLIARHVCDPCLFVLFFQARLSVWQPLIQGEHRLAISCLDITSTRRDFLARRVSPAAPSVRKWYHQVDPLIINVPDLPKRQRQCHALLCLAEGHQRGHYEWI